MFPQALPRLPLPYFALLREAKSQLAEQLERLVCHQLPLGPNRFCTAVDDVFGPQNLENNPRMKALPALNSTGGLFG